MARVVVYLLLALYLTAVAPLLAQDSAPPDVPAPVAAAPAPSGQQGQLVVGINEAVAAIGALVLAVSSAAVAIKRLIATGRQLRAVISGVEVAGGDSVKQAIAAKAEQHGVGEQLAARVERETKRLAGGAS